jgi:hypothetical protein
MDPCKKLLLCLLIMAGCSSGGRMMTMDSFYGIPIGATKDEVVQCAGSPAECRLKCSNVEELEYIERINAGARLLQERRYILTLRNGKVVSKRVEQSSPAPTTFDSYEMQTTEKDSK